MRLVASWKSRCKKCSSAGAEGLHYTGLRKIIYCPHVKKKGRKSGDAKAERLKTGKAALDRME
jgi:hypothetical protein